MVCLRPSVQGEARHGCGTSPLSGVGAVRAAALLLTLTLAVRGGDAASDDPKSLVREAFLAARDGLQSGKGKGGYHLYREDGSLRDDTGFEIEFQGDKFKLELIYRKRPRSGPPADRQIAISDGSAIFVNSFSERLQPHGSETKVFEAGNVPKALPDFGYDLRRLPCRLMSLEEWEEHAPRFEQLPEGGYRCTFDLTERSEATLEFAPEYGYNVAVREERSTVGRPISRRYTASWKKARGVWYIERLLREDWRDGKSRGDIELWYDEFEVNPPVSADLFTLDNLAMAEGSRLRDERPGAPVRFHKVPPSVETVEDGLDTMIAQAEALPPLYQTEQVKSAWGLRIWGLAIGLLGIAVIAVVWFIQRRKAA